MTILEGLNCLPEPYRSQALKNTYPHKDYWAANSVSLCLNFAFSWLDSSEGYNHWLSFDAYLATHLDKDGEFYVDSNNKLHRHRIGSYNPARTKIIFKIRIKRK